MEHRIQRKALLTAISRIKLWYLGELSTPGVPNLWLASQKWPAKPQKVALDLSKNKKKNIYEKLQKFTVLQDIGLLK